MKKSFNLSPLSQQLNKKPFLKACVFLPKHDQSAESGKLF